MVPLDQLAASLIGTPFRHRGRDPADGLDCWGLVVLIYRRCYGIALPGHDDLDGSSAQRAAAAAAVAQDRALAWLAVAPGQERAGDVILLRRFGRPLHIAVVLGGQRMLHADEPVGVTAPRYDSSAWTCKMTGPDLGFHRHPSLA